MRLYDLVIRGEQVFVAGQLRALDLGISGGRITAIAERASLRGSELFDAGSNIVAPGAIDIHVHFRDPGFTDMEDFAHGTAAAACGGVTCVCDMPNTNPATTTAARLVAKAAALERSAHVDFALWAGGNETHRLRSLAEAGAIGCKVFMVRRNEELFMVDDARLLDILAECARLGWLASVHVGDDGLANVEKQRLVAAGRNSPSDYLDWYRGLAPQVGLAKLLTLALHTGARVHVAHVSPYHPRCLDLIKAYRRLGAQVTTEIDPPALDHADLVRLGGLGLPFVLSSEEQSRNWQMLEADEIDILATDHSPHTLAEVERIKVNAWTGSTGFPAVETLLPIAFDAVLRRKLSLAGLIRAIAHRPAQLVGLAGKGRIEMGADADMVVLDPRAKSTISARSLHSKAAWTPFEGRQLRGRIKRTYVRGHLVAQDGEMVGGASVGAWIKRSAQLGAEAYP